MSDQPDLSSFTLDDFIDTAILRHGFMPYSRDYFFHIEALYYETWAGEYLLIFKHCYEMSYQVITGADVVLQSWDDCFINWDDYEKAGSPEGYVWGTKWVGAYPGFSMVQDSQKAKDWTERLGKTMQEVQLEADIMRMNFTFYEWELKKLNDETGLISQVLFPL